MNEVMHAAEKLVESVEFDVNGAMGKGGNGGLISDTSIKAAGALRVAINRAKTPSPISQMVGSEARRPNESEADHIARLLKACGEESPDLDGDVMGSEALLKALLECISHAEEEAEDYLEAVPGADVSDYDVEIPLTVAKAIATALSASPPLRGSTDIEMEASSIVSALSRSLTDRGLSIGQSNLDDGHTIHAHIPLKDEWQRIVEDGLRRSRATAVVEE